MTDICAIGPKELSNIPTQLHDIHWIVEQPLNKQYSNATDIHWTVGDRSLHRIYGNLCCEITYMKEGPEAEIIAVPVMLFTPC